MAEFSLEKSAQFRKKKGPVVLLIMDGVGIGPDASNNAVHIAQTPFLDNCQRSPLYRTLRAHGLAVGMPTDQDMGNSEVGHNALGAGRVFDQGATLVQNAVESGAVFQSKTWKESMAHVQSNESTLHLITLLSDGNVHAHIDHLKAVITEAVSEGTHHIRLHTLTDGRDVAGRSALKYLSILRDLMAGLPSYADVQFASGGGRMLITMDRYNAEWPMVERGWRTHVLGEGPQFETPEAAVEAAYAANADLNDQYIPPFVIAKDGRPTGKIQDGDAVLFLNFRGDRAMELCQAFEEKDFTHFERERVPDVFFAGMMEYDGDLHIPRRYLVNPPNIEGALSQYLCGEGLKTFGISETQKYGHVTYFWNGNKSGYINEALETYIEIPSDTVPFDQKPEMKAFEITEKTIQLLETGHYAFGRVNFPNGDMVGHTGNMTAAVRSVEVTDQCVARISSVVSEMDGITIILADHGNADDMFAEDGTPKTAHTLNPVPFVIIDKGRESYYQLADLPGAGLANVAATICNLMGYDAPQDYDASLIKSAL